MKKIEKIRSRGIYVNTDYIDVYTTGLLEYTSRIINYSIFGINLIKVYVKNRKD
jgi:hypothetical protein